MTSQARTPRRWVRFLAVALLFFGILLQASAQTRGSIAGSVSDQNGALLQGAVVSVQSPDLKASTDEQVRFFINNLAP